MVNKAAEAKVESLGNKIANKIVKPKHVTDENLKIVEKITVPPEKRKEILHQLRQVI